MSKPITTTPIDFDALPFGEKYYIKQSMDHYLLLAFSVGRAFDRNMEAKAILNEVLPHKTIELDVDAHSSGIPATLKATIQVKTENLDHLIEAYKEALSTHSSEPFIFFSEQRPDYDEFRLIVVAASEYHEARSTIDTQSNFNAEEKHRRALDRVWQIIINFDLHNSTNCRFVEEVVGEEVIPEKRVKKTVRKIVCE